MMSGNLKTGKGKKTLLKKILTVIGIPIVAAYCLSSVITLNSVHKTVENLTDIELKAESQEASHEIAGILNGYMGTTNQMAVNAQFQDAVATVTTGQPATVCADYAQIVKTLINIKESDSNILDAWIADVDSNQMFLTTGYYSSPDWICTERPWYIEMKEKDGTVMTSPYVDATTLKTVVSAVTPIYKAGTKEIIGAAGLDITLDSIKELMSSYTVGDTGYFMLVSNDGQFIFHPNSELINTSVKDSELSQTLKDAITSKKTGNVEFENDDIVSHGFIDTVGATGWTVTSALPDKEFDRTFNNVRLISLSIMAVVVILITFLIVFVSRRIVAPIRQLAGVANQLSTGDVDVNTDDIVFISDEIRELTGAFSSMAENTKMQADVMAQIAEGDLSLDVRPRSEKDILAVSMAKVVSTLRELVKETDLLTESATQGNLEVRGNAESFAGGFKEIVVGVNTTLDALIEPLNVAADYVDHIGRGEMPEKITAEYRGDFNLIKENLNSCIDSVNALISDANMLSKAAVEGSLSTRADISGHKGDFAKIMEGVNATLDALTGPLNASAGYIEKIGMGIIPDKIEDQYQGDFNKLKNSINSCIDGLEGLKEGRDILKKMSLNDYTQKVEGTYSGIFAEMKDSINDVSARVLNTIRVTNNVASGDLEDLEDLIKVGKRSENDQLIPAFIKMMGNLKALVEETAVLTEASVRGDLAVRGDVSKFSGEYAKVIEGINQTMDAVTEPIAEAAAALAQLEKGDLSAMVRGDYQGEHALIKNALNQTAENLRSYIFEISNVLIEIGKGNLDLSITADYTGDFLQIKDSLNSIIEQLSQVLGNISEASEQVNASARQVSDGAQTLSQGSTEQASSIEELSASITEVAAQTKQNAVDANQANGLATEAKMFAEKGNLQMKEMLESMSEINQSSANISKVIKVIDDIAFQTNILALNAAVEAARAGQHGKGFAVVAEEVRNLAARSAAAAKETTALIEGSVETVSVGTRNANETAEALSGIVGKIGEAADLVQNIAEASNIQATAIAQIDKGIEQVSQVVQNNSATAEQSAAASEELSGQSAFLREMVGSFKLRNTDGAKPLQLSAHTDGLPSSQVRISFDESDQNKY